MMTVGSRSSHARRWASDPHATAIARGSSRAPRNFRPPSPTREVSGLYCQAVPTSWQWNCADCAALVKELQEAWREDERDLRMRFHETARSAGVSPEAFLRGWVDSVAQIADEELESFQDAWYPRVAHVRRRWKEHEEHSGHRGPSGGWRAAFIADVALRSGYGGLLKRRDP